MCTNASRGTAIAQTAEEETAKRSSIFDKWKGISEEFRGKLRDEESRFDGLGLEKSHLVDAANVSNLSPVRISDYHMDVWDADRSHVEDLYVKVITKAETLRLKAKAMKGEISEIEARYKARSSEKHSRKYASSMDDEKLIHTVNGFINVGAIRPLKKDEKRKIV